VKAGMAQPASSVALRSSTRAFIALGLATLALLSLPQFAEFAGAASSGQRENPAASAQITKLSNQVDDLSNRIQQTNNRIDQTNTIVKIVLSPIALLVAILALGGSLGIVFSIRDQRRVSQLHELTVGSETLSQRRTEQSYASFFEQSQTTLALVNDTLELAKEATEGATQSMEVKAKAQIDAIEERAEALLDRVFGREDFELLVEDAGNRGDLHAIGDSLRSLEGYLSLQNIKLPQHTKFIKAIDQFLLDDTEGALHALRRLSQDRLSGELHRFTLFWLGYIYTTVGDYELAVRTFREDEIGLSDDDTERFQLECIIGETRFFETAKERRGEDVATSGSGQTPREPWERFEAVATLLDELSKLAVEVAESKESHNLHHVSLEVARTRADIYTWIAYDPKRIDDPIAKTPIAHARKAGVIAEASVDETMYTLTREPRGEGDNLGKVKEAVDLKDDASAVAFMNSPAWKELEKPDDVRAWANLQALEICRVQEKPNFYVKFALAEAHFMLRDKEAKQAFEIAEEALSDEFGEHREKRRNASLEQSSMICHSRLHHLMRKRDPRRKDERRLVVQVSRKALETVNEMRQSRVTVFSQIQRRNVAQAEFSAEIKRIVSQDRMAGEEVAA
jgi:tetratricopeptide (TPR) repeat protein